MYNNYFALNTWKHPYNILNFEVGSLKHKSVWPTLLCLYNDKPL